MSSPIMQALAAALAAGPAKMREESFYKPRLQELYHFEKYQWKATPTDWNSSFSTPSSPDRAFNPKSVRLISWNIDILVPFVEERMSAALEYLSSLVNSSPVDVPVIVFLQEMGPSDVEQIKNSAWIQERFFVTDINTSHWLSDLYGTVTLIDRRLTINRAFRVPWISNFERDGLFIDIALAGSSQPSDSKEKKVLRLCNTHLESLVADPPVRPRQLSAAAVYLHEVPPVAASLLAGDLNAIQPFDRTLHSDNKLRDAYLELGGKEDSDEGYTWGQQVPKEMREKFGCSRMDKILYGGEVEVKAFERIGIDVRVAEDKRKDVNFAGQLEWVTDHYGVMGDFALGDGLALDTGGAGGAPTKAKLS